MDKQEAESFFEILYCGKHHFPSEVREYGEGFYIVHNGEVATYDADFLTRLVFLAHDMCYRASVEYCNPGRIKICIFKRTPGGKNFFDKHPTIEHALKIWRKNNYKRSADED